MFAALYVSNAGQLDIDILHLQQDAQMYTMSFVVRCTESTPFVRLP